MKKKSKVYFRMFLSCLSILAIPMILAMMLYVYTFRIIRGQAEEMNGNLMHMVKNDLDYEMQSIWKNASRMALDDRVLQAANARNTFDSINQMNLYYLFQECENVNMSEDIIGDMFLVFNYTQKVVSSRGNMSEKMFYDIYYKNSEMPYEKFQEYMKAFHYGDILPLHLESGEEIFVFTMTTLKSPFDNAPAAVCFEIKADSIRERLQQMKWSDHMDVMLLMDSNVKISADEQISEHYDWDYALWESGNHELVNEIGERYIVSVLPSSVVKWKYLAMMPVRQMEQEAQKVRSFAVVGLLLCMVMGIVVSYYITNRNYNPIKMLLDNVRQQRKVEIKEGENEYQWLNSQMNAFFKQHVDAEQLIKKNKKSLKQYYLSQLLQEYCDGTASEQHGLSVQGHYNVVILMTPTASSREMNAGELNAIEENALQKFAIINVFEEMCLDYFHINMVELGEKVAAIVSLPDDRREHLDTLKTQTENLQQMMEESFGFSVVVLMGSICEGWEGIHDSYLQALRLEQYVHLLDTRLLLYDEVKDIQPHYHYPLELEQKIINAIKVGDSEKAWKSMEQAFDLNLCGQVTANIYRCLIYGLVGTLLEGASQGGYQDATKELTVPDSDFFHMTTGKMKQQFHELLDKICQRILQIQKETAQDQALSKKIQEYIQENYQDADLNISITSQHFDLTPAYLSSIYKKQTGGSLLEYINTVRLTNAEQFLEQGYSVVEVAQMSGFRDSGTFIRAFKKKKGVTPGQLKKKNQEI